MSLKPLSLMTCRLTAWSLLFFFPAVVYVLPAAPGFLLDSSRLPARFEDPLDPDFSSTISPPAFLLLSYSNISYASSGSATVALPVLLAKEFMFTGGLP